MISKRNVEQAQSGRIAIEMRETPEYTVEACVSIIFGGKMFENQSEIKRRWYKTYWGKKKKDKFSKSTDELYFIVMPISIFLCILQNMPVQFVSLIGMHHIFAAILRFSMKKQTNKQTKEYKKLSLG